MISKLIFHELLSPTGSNGDMYSFDLRNDSLEKLPGKKHATETSVIPSKITKILELSPSHIALVGMGKGDEGESIYVIFICLIFLRFITLGL